MTHYERLGISADASTAEVERAFRRCARAVHPDLNSGDPAAAEAQMKELNEIRDVLSTPSLRAAYDQSLRPASAPPAAPPAPPAPGPRWARMKVAAVAGLGAVAAAALLSLWPRDSPPAIAIPVADSAEPVLSVPTIKPTRATDAPPRPTRAKLRGRGTIRLGSTADEVFAAFGPPDRVIPGRQTGDATLVYGSLRLEMNNGRVTGGDAANR
jgi:curved DNA-binding protein CbpA